MPRRSASYEINMTEGPLLSKIIRFSIPLILTSILQLLYNAADIVVVGRFAGSTALAAVSSPSSMINLMVNFFMGLSLGASVLVGQYYGAGDVKGVSDTVHTTITMSLLCGTAVAVLGLCFGKTLLRWMGTPPEVLSLANVYVLIYFAGSPFNLLYNFGAAVLRAVGDTKRPMYFLIISGLVNVVLNLVFVIGFHMSVAGVALATVISQVISALLVMRCLLHTDSAIRVSLRHLRFVRDKAARMVMIGLPAALQSAVFSISNVLIQSSVNSFGADAMAGNGAANNIESFIYTSMSAIYTACLTFTSQNVGARKGERLTRILGTCLLCVIAVAIAMGAVVMSFKEQLLGIYCTDPRVIQLGTLRINAIVSTYALCGVMDVLVGSLRGMGDSVRPMVVSILGVCVFRVVWVFTVFAAHRSLEMLYLSYPISWTLTAAAHFICWIFVRKKTAARLKAA